MNRGYTLLLFFLVLLGLPGCRQGEAIQPELHLSKGQQLQYEITTEQEIQQNQLGQSIGIQQTIGYTLQMQVLDTDKQGNYVIWTKYTHVFVHQKAPNDEETYDSDSTKDSIPALAAPFAQLNGSIFQMTLSPKGKVLDIMDYDEMLKSVAAEAAGGRDSLNKQVMDSMAKYLDRKRLAENIESSWDIFPDHPVREGDSWTKKQATESGMGISVMNTYTLEKIEKNTLSISIQSEISSSPANNMAGMNYQISGTQKGSIQVDRGSGMVSDGQYTQNLKGKLYRRGVGESMVIPVEIHSKVRFKSKVL